MGPSARPRSTGGGSGGGESASSGPKASDDAFSLEREVGRLGKERLLRLVLRLAEWSTDNRRLVLESLKGSGVKGARAALDDERAFELWDEACETISQFNELGGGPEDDEVAACDLLSDVGELARKGRLSAEARMGILEDAFEEYDEGNSGFDDALVDLFFELCRTREEWELLIAKLEAHPSEWRSYLVMTVLRDKLCDHDAYLRMREGSLRSGMDYWELAKFHLDRGELDKAVGTAERGIAKGEGRLDDLFGFLFEHYAKLGDGEALERLARTAVERKSCQKEVLDRLFEFWKGRGEYERARDALLGAWAHVQRDRYKEYKRVKGFLRDADWREVEPRLSRELQEKSLKEWLRICLDKGMKDTVRKVVLGKKPPSCWELPEEDADLLVDGLSRDYPEEVMEHYWSKARGRIQWGHQRGSYREAARFLGKAKDIQVRVLKDGAGWTKRISALREEHVRRRALIEELRGL